MIKLIIFDYDGVIVDSFQNIYDVYKTICKKLNIKSPKDIEKFRHIYGYNFIECYKNLGIPIKNHEKAGKIFKHEILKKKPKLFTGIRDVIKELKKDYILALITANYKDEAIQKLQKNNLLKYFSSVLGAENEDRFSKPNAIAETMNKFRVNKNEVVYIGDRIIDYDAAQKAGLEHILIVDYGWGYDKNKIPKQKFTIKNPKDLLKAVEYINKK